MKSAEEILGAYFTLEKANEFGLKPFLDGKSWIITHIDLPKMIDVIVKAMEEYKNQFQ